MRLVKISSFPDTLYPSVAFLYGGLRVRQPFHESPASGRFVREAGKRMIASAIGLLMLMLPSYHFNVMQCMINYKINNRWFRRVDPVSSREGERANIAIVGGISRSSGGFICGGGQARSLVVRWDSRVIGFRTVMQTN
jgi:hypothetical protein